MNSINRIGVLGASSMVGKRLLPLLVQSNNEVLAFSRDAEKHRKEESNPNVLWAALSEASDVESAGSIKEWISFIPIWKLSGFLPFLKTYGAHRIVALSSTSRFTKEYSSDKADRELSKEILISEEKLASWAKDNDINWTVLRPTLIYGHGLDKNISEIARLINKFGMFPLLGTANGLRQPVHVDDVAGACMQALDTPQTFNRAYNIPGSEKLTYREMVKRVFVAMNKKPRIVTVPLIVFWFAMFILRYLHRFRDVSVATIERMVQDMVFEYTDATRDFGFAPRKFILTQQDIPKL
ncbi:MAG: NAD-dependent epimerase/dehydratase family protein [Gammaproteobacteria bacterium]|nr:MAG: NAD-dependent epimerase/dehydratase family protein [Gammaproteobacteria bacterium]